MTQLKIVEAERDTLIAPTSEAAPTPATMLAQPKGIGSPIATMLCAEALCGCRPGPRTTIDA